MKRLLTVLLVGALVLGGAEAQAQNKKKKSSKAKMAQSDKKGKKGGSVAVETPSLCHCR